jgi:hypothetical protein
MAAKDMTDALKNPHPTISALVDLAAIFKLKLEQTTSPAPKAVSSPVFQQPSLAA